MDGRYDGLILDNFWPSDLFVDLSFVESVGASELVVA